MNQHIIHEYSTNKLELFLEQKSWQSGNAARQVEWKPWWQTLESLQFQIFILTRELNKMLHNMQSGGL